MSLKGYQWLDNGRVVMAFDFKRCYLDLYADVTKSQLDEFIRYIESKHNHIIKTNDNGFKIKEG